MATTLFEGDNLAGAALFHDFGKANPDLGGTNLAAARVEVVPSGPAMSADC